MEKKYSTLNVLLITLLFSFTALAQVANDECNSAIFLQPDSPFDNCEFSLDVTLLDATPSADALGCSNNPANDVWYEFTAINEHYIISCGITSNVNPFRLTVYSGDCDNLTPFICTNTPNAASNNFIIGQTYKIRIFSTIIPPAPGPLTFHLCISNGPELINTNITQYTNEQLVTDVLINSPCMNVSNITYTTGDVPGEFTGIGYFEKGATNFPFERGLVLSTGNITNVSSSLEILNSNNGNSSGDIDLTQIMATEDIIAITTNASSIEFDFTPVIDHISFDFIYASNEYGTYQCNAVDPFAILLTDLTTGEIINLAVTPVTNKIIAVSNIKNSMHNINCASQNQQYFDSFGNNANRPINVLGNTVPLTAKSAVTPGHSYHIKFVIADTYDAAIDSYVFINAANFNIISNDPLEYVTLNSSNGNALCNGENTTLSVNLDETYTYIWSLNNEVLVGENQNSLTVTDAGVYSLKIDLPQGNCSIEYNIVINTSTSSAINQIVIPDLIEFSEQTNSHTFNLATVTSQIVIQPGNENYTITYHHTTADAETNSNQLGATYSTSANPQTIYARISNGFCFTIKSFNLIFIAPATGLPFQNFSEGETLADLEVIGENIKWYANPQWVDDTLLPLTTLLTDGMSYYATQTINGMENPYRFRVTTSLVLDLKDNTFTNLHCYPNPVNEVLNISNTNEIEEAVVYNYLGQEVMNLQTNSTDVNINMSHLEQGIYLIKIKSDGKQKTLKVIKY